MDGNVNKGGATIGSGAGDMSPRPTSYGCARFESWGESAGVTRYCDGFSIVQNEKCITSAVSTSERKDCKSSKFYPVAFIRFMTLITIPFTTC